MKCKDCKHYFAPIKFVLLPSGGACKIRDYAIVSADLEGCVRGEVKNEI